LVLLDPIVLMEVFGFSMVMEMRNTVARKEGGIGLVGWAGQGMASREG
jgi:hypothetical protein